MNQKFDTIIVGAGIIGLAHAYLEAKSGRSVAVIEKSERAIGASVRNLGMIWPIGQPTGHLREVALRSRDLWLEIASEAGIWVSECGSLHLAYEDDEFQVLSEFAKNTSSDAEAPVIITPEEAIRISPHLRQDSLRGALYSKSELCVDPRTTVNLLANYLQKECGVDFRYQNEALFVDTETVVARHGTFKGDRIIVCLGPNTDQLFPDFFADRSIKLCKLQMLRAIPKSNDYQIGAHLCAGLTSLHYSNFASCPSLPQLRERLSTEFPDHIARHIHVLVSQHEDGSLTIGDSHEYGTTFEPFSDETNDRLILEYLDRFLPIGEVEIAQRWQGFYPKHPTEPYLVEQPADRVWITSVLSGIGMTMSFGLAEHAIKEIYKK